MISPGTKRAEALRGVADADDPVTGGEVGDGLYEPLRTLHDDGFVDRHGEGGPGDPYRYTLTSKGKGVVQELRNGDERDEDDDTGLDVLFPEVEDKADDEYAYEVLPDTSTVDDIEYGTRYRVRVNNTEGYGVFVSFTTSTNYGDEVSGLIHKSRIPALHTPSDFNVDDEVGVMLVDRTEKGPELELVAAFDTVRNVDFEAEPSHAPAKPIDPDPEPEPEAVDEPEAEAVDDADDSLPAKGSKVDNIARENVALLADRIDSLSDKVAAMVDANERIADTERYVDGIDDRLHGIEDTVADLQAEVEAADDPVLSEDDRVEAAYYIANSERGGARTKKRLIRSLMGFDTDGPEDGQTSVDDYAKEDSRAKTNDTTTDKD